jgi:hypothetical protein
VSLVSVTQRVHAAPSRGHILLSFVRVDGELGGERVRDKIAAGHAKGTATAAVRFFRRMTITRALRRNGAQSRYKAGRGCLIFSAIKREPVTLL